MAEQERTSRRIVVVSSLPFAALRARFEELVPALDLAGAEDDAGAGLAWEALRGGAEWPAEYGLLRFGAEDPGAVLRPAAVRR
ncbi:hypothetical protein ACQ3I4_10690 [Zafaria sp. Z1313]|uniref:hypothetical protein n=1 Tax=unclassified Zafaria TaxID=2828765 RepID=UPI002E7A7368|nr:hypothetical protein [Zafaria sp. J156]MEE1622214.1 hypothetical protein [Zafaria sp. J156]